MFTKVNFSRQLSCFTQQKRNCPQAQLLKNATFLTNLPRNHHRQLRIIATRAIRHHIGYLYLQIIFFKDGICGIAAHRGILTVGRIHARAVDLFRNILRESQLRGRHQSVIQKHLTVNVHLVMGLQLLLLLALTMVRSR